MASILKVDTLQKPDGSTPTAADLGIGLTSDDMPAGSVVQVQRTLITGPVVFSGSQNSTIKSPLEVNITPKFANSLIQIYVRMTGECGASAHDYVTAMFRDNTRINEPADADQRTMGIAPFYISYHGDDNNSTSDGSTFTTIDTPNTTNQVTYCLGFRSASGTLNYYMNRTVGDNNSSGYKRTTSEIIVTEIKQ